MIVKKLSRTSFKKSKFTMIGDLVDYILAKQQARLCRKQELSDKGRRYPEKGNNFSCREIHPEQDAGHALDSVMARKRAAHP